MSQSWICRSLVLCTCWTMLGMGLERVRAEDGFQPIFDGQTLAGWRANDVRYWSIEDGAITGQITPEQPCTVNQYLVWQGGELRDFELKLSSRLTGDGAINNGFQFRSRLLPDGDICGYQVDNNLQTDWQVRLYDEYGRHTLAMRGVRTTLDPQGQASQEVIPSASGAAWFRLEDWHEYHLRCEGPQISLHINGQLAAEVIDHDWRRQELQGVLALQLHSGPPTRVQFKDLRLRILRPAVPTADPDDSAQEPRQRLQSAALAWWRLDDGAHGATPALRHIPAWEQFELNVRPDGPGAGPHPILLLDGAHFESDADLPLTDSQLTVYLRLRDPRGTWHAGLMNKQVLGQPAPFRLSAGPSSDDAVAQIAWQVATETGIASCHLPVTQIAPTAWHDVVGRYDGKQLSLFCDGELMASRPCTGRMLTHPGPVWIGAEQASDGSTHAAFHGELETAAIWTRALTDDEIKTLSRR